MRDPLACGHLRIDRRKLTKQLQRARLGDPRDPDQLLELRLERLILFD
jgi:hypothetical protein